MGGECGGIWSSGLALGAGRKAKEGGQGGRGLVSLVGQHILVWVLGEEGGLPGFSTDPPQTTVGHPRSVGASPLARAQHPSTDLTRLTNDLSASNLEVAMRLVPSLSVSRCSNRLSVPGLCCLFN